MFQNLNGPSIAVLFCLAAAPAFAELPAARLDTIFPPGGRSGAEVEVAITGTDLDEAKELLFSDPRITASFKSDKHFVVKIAPEVLPGVYDVRVAGLLGISNPRAFAVGDLPEVAKTKPNTTAQTALTLPIPSTVSGAATAAATDYFSFSAKRGERVLIDCEAAQLDSKLSPVLTVLAESGGEVASSLHGGFLDFSPPSDGLYLITVHDVAYAGGADYAYRLSIGTGPHIDYVLPPFATPGARAKFSLYGRRLPGSTPANVTSTDGKPLERLDVEIDVPAKNETNTDGLTRPAAASLEGFSYRLKTAQSYSNPVFIGFSALPVLVEQEPNNQPTEGQKLTVPCQVAGQFFPANDRDRFVFDAKKGDVYWIEVASQRLGEATNPLLVVQRDTTDVQEAYGTDAATTELRFPRATNDPTAKFEAKEDGPYRLVIRDLFGGTKADPGNVYSLCIRQPKPDFSLLAVAEPLPEKKDDRTAAPLAPVLRAAGTTGIKVFAFRRDGFAGDIELCASDLPAGVTCVPTRILSGKSEGVLLLTVAEKVERWAGPIRITGRAVIDGKEASHEARGGTVLWATKDYNTDPVSARLTRDISVAASPEFTPITVEPAEDKEWEVPVGGKVQIPLKITRRGEYKEALKLKAEGAPGIDTLKELDVDAKATTANLALDLATAKLPAGLHTIYLTAVTKGKFHGKDAFMSLYSAPIRVSVKAPEAPAKAAETPAKAPETTAKAADTK